MRESDVETYLVKRVRCIGGATRKVKWIGRHGAPDRLVLFDGAHFVELKRPNGVLDDHQRREKQAMEFHGVDVHVISSKDEVDEFIAKIAKHYV